MSKFDFETVLEREGRDALAVDVIPVEGAEVKEGFSRIPMWVADMHLPTCPSVIEAIQGRLAHPNFGYFAPRQEYYDAIFNWQKNRNGVEGLTKENIGYENGVLGGVASALQIFTAPGESILMHSPTYIGFTGVVTNNGRKIVLSELKKDADGIWRMDYEDMDRKIKENKIHFCIFCSPHNPAGRVWEREEIEQAMEVYRKNNCVVISDEIWSDLILEGHKHIPTQSVSEDAKMRTIAFYAPTKTFSLAGFVGSYHIIYNPYFADRMEKQASLSHYNSMNVLSMYALIGAYSKTGAEWVDELCELLTGNVKYACDYIEAHFKGVDFARPQGTYMLYLNCTEYLKAHNMTIDELLKAGVACGVIWQDGRPFNHPDSIRMNVALPRKLVEEAFDRLDRYVFNK